MLTMNSIKNTPLSQLAKLHIALETTYKKNSRTEKQSIQQIPAQKDPRYAFTPEKQRQLAAWLLNE